jgi:hypothetical protein
VKDATSPFGPLYEVDSANWAAGVSDATSAEMLSSEARTWGEFQAIREAKRAHADWKKEEPKLPNTFLYRLTSWFFRLF